MVSDEAEVVAQEGLRQYLFQVFSLVTGRALGLLPFGLVLVAREALSHRRHRRRVGPDHTLMARHALSADPLHAQVLVVIEGRAAGEALRRTSAPVDAAIIGIIDTITVDVATESELAERSRPA